MRVAGRYEEWTLAELRDWAEWKEVEGYGRMRKHELVATLQASDRLGTNTPW